MKALVIAYYGCLSEAMNCSLSKQQRVCIDRASGDLSFVITQTLKLPLYWEEDAHGFSFGHLVQRFIAVL
jgi:hypothetical protein